MRIGRAVLFKYGGEAHVPEAAEVAFLIFPVFEGISAGVNDGFVGLSFFGGPTVPITLSFAKNVSKGAKLREKLANCKNIDEIKEKFEEFI